MVTLNHYLILSAILFAIGTLAGCHAIPAEFARRVLLRYASQIPSYDPRRPWGLGELEAKVTRAFNDGMRHPREAPHA